MIARDEPVVQKAFRLEQDYWNRVEQTRQELQRATPYKVTQTDALRHIIQVGSGSVAVHGQLQRPPGDGG